MIATGAEYRRPRLKDLSRFEGVGVYYGATFVEAQLCGGEEVNVVGGGNSAGQAAVFLAETTKRVHMLVRSAGLAESMSRYLIRRIEETATIVLRPYTEIVALEGGDHLESVRWRNSQTGETEEHKISHVFVMTGADPNTRWLDGRVTLDTKGFIMTGPDLLQENLSTAGWPLTRQPYLLETSLPGVFAAGDVRAAASSVLHQQWVKDRSLSHLFIKYSRNSTKLRLSFALLVFLISKKPSCRYLTISSSSI